MRINKKPGFGRAFFSRFVRSTVPRHRYRHRIHRHGRILLLLQVIGQVLAVLRGAVAEDLVIAALRPGVADQRVVVLGAFARALPDLAEAARSPEQLVAIAAKRVRARDGDDVDDPIGLSSEVYADCAEQIDELVTPVVAALAKLT